MCVHVCHGVCVGSEDNCGSQFSLACEFWGQNWGQQAQQHVSLAFTHWATSPDPNLSFIILRSSGIHEAEWSLAWHLNQRLFLTESRNIQMYIPLKQTEIYPQSMLKSHLHFQLWVKLSSPHMFYNFIKLIQSSGVLSTYMYMPHLRAWCPQRSEESIRSPGTGGSDGYEPSVGAGSQAWLEEQYVLSTDASLQNLTSIFKQLQIHERER